MKLGISFRVEWLNQWDKLRLERFEYFEVVPNFTMREREIVSRILLRLEGKRIFFHLTSTSLCDDHEYFKKHLLPLVELSRGVSTAGISLHFGLGQFEGKRLPCVFSVPGNPFFLKRAQENLLHARSVLSAPVSVECLSSAFDFKGQGDYLGAYRELLDSTSTLALIDYSNLSKTCRNEGSSFSSRIAELNGLGIQYGHVGGSYATSGSSVIHDSHHEFQSDPEISKNLIASPNSHPLIYEQDADLLDVAKCRIQIENFERTYGAIHE